MNRIVLAALLAAVAMPAWAANVALEVTVSVSLDVMEVCERAGAPLEVCIMRYAATEAMALSLAKHVLTTCPARVGSDEADCGKSLAYIKQRWGY